MTDRLQAVDALLALKDDATLPRRGSRLVQEGRPGRHARIPLLVQAFLAQVAVARQNEKLA
jgi:hypothetical protein